MEQNKKELGLSIEENDLTLKLIDTFKGIKPFIKENKEQYYTIIRKFIYGTKYKYKVVAIFHYNNNKKRKEVYLSSEVIKLAKLNKIEAKELKDQATHNLSSKGENMGEIQVQRFELENIVRWNTKKVSFLLLENGKYSEVKLNVFNNVIDQRIMSMRANVYRIPFLEDKVVDNTNFVVPFPLPSSNSVPMFIREQKAKGEFYEAMDKTTRFVEEHPVLKDCHLNKRLAGPVFIDFYSNFKTTRIMRTEGFIIVNEINKTVSIEEKLKIDNLSIPLSKTKTFEADSREMVYSIFPDRIYQVVAYSNPNMSDSENNEFKYIYGSDLINIIIDNGLGEKTTLK